MREAIPSTGIELRQGAPLDRIVVPLAPHHVNDRGLNAASALAIRWNLPVHLVTVDTDEAKTDDDFDQMLEKEVAALRSHGVAEVTSAVLTEVVDPVAAIVSGLTGFDLVVMASQGTRYPGGSFAQSLTHLWGGPVLMLGPHAELKDLTGDIVVGLDGSALAEESLAPAAAIAAALGVRMKIIEAVSAAVTEQVERLKGRGERVSESTYIRHVADLLGADRVSWAVAHSDHPARALAQEAERGAGMLVLATHGQSGLTHSTLDSVCMETVSIASKPVLVIRPTSSAD